MLAPSSGPSGLAARRARIHGVRQLSLLAGSSVVASALLVAGCGSVTSSKGSGTPPKLRIGAGAGTVTGTGTAAGRVNNGAMAPAAVAPGPINGLMRIFGGYVLDGWLPTQPTHAAVWQWTPGEATKADVLKLAGTFALVGTPERHAHGWDLSSPTGDLRVSDSAGHAWSYSRAGAQCPVDQVDIDDDDDTVTGCAISAPAPASTLSSAPASTISSAPLDGPDEAATKAAAASLLGALGITGTDEVEVGSPSSELTVAPVVGGLQTQGIETTVDVDASGIVGATGTLDQPTAGDEYPLRTAKDAFDELSNRPEPMIARYCGPIPGGPIRIGPIQAPQTGSLPPSATTDLPVPTAIATANPGGPMIPASPPPSGAAAPPTDLADSPDADSSAVACPAPEPVKITGATLGLELVGDAAPDGSSLLAPAWFFDTADASNSVTAIAISDDFLEGSPAPTAVASANQAAPPSPVGSGEPAFPPAFPPAAPSRAASSSG